MRTLSHAVYHKSYVELFIRAKITRREHSRDIGIRTGDGSNRGNNIVSRGRDEISANKGD